MKVPEDTRNIALETPTTRAPTMPQISMPGVVPAAFGADVGKAYEQLGKVGMQIAGHLQQMALDEQDKEVLRRETTYRQDLQNRLFNQEDETIQINGQDATRKKGLLLRQFGQAKGATEELDQIYQQQIRNQYLNGLSKYQYDKLGPALDNYYMSIRNNVIAHEANQLDEDFKNTTESNLKQKIADASLIKDDKAMAFAIDDAIKSAAPYYRKYDPATQKILNAKITTDIVSASVDSAPNFAIADTLLLAVKDKLPGDFYNEKRNELLNNFKKAQKAAELIAVETKNKREDGLFTQSILNPGSITRSFLETELANKAISPEFTKAMINNIESIKTIDAKPNSSTFNKLVDYILADNKPEDIRMELLKENAKGEITDDELSILNTFNQNITKETLENVLPKKNFLQTLSFWSDENAGKHPEVKTQMFKEYLKRVSAGEAPGEVIQEIIKKQTINLNPSIASHSEKGQLMVDKNGNKAIVYPDGTIEPYGGQLPSIQSEEVSDYMKKQPTRKVPQYEISEEKK